MSHDYLPWHTAPPSGEYESTTTIDMIAYSAMIRQKGREAERRAIIAYLMWVWGTVESISEQDGIVRLCEAIKNCEHIRKGAEL